jgi:polyphosphate glucokinase
MSSPTAPRPLTLGIDVGGSFIKASVLDAEGRQLEQEKVEPTPRPATPEVLLPALVAVAEGLDFDRVSLGFPGVVVDGVTKTAPNLDEGWTDHPLSARLAEALARPVRVCNDADLAGLGVAEGRGVEMILTFGTGMGSAILLDGRLVPNLELGHHPFRDGLSYEEYSDDATLKRIGAPAWCDRVMEIVALTRRIWNYRRIYLGGGNARLLDKKTIAPDAIVVDNRAAILGAIKLWEHDNG